MIIFKCDKCGYTTELEAIRDTRLKPHGMIGWLKELLSKPDDHWRASQLTIIDIEWILALRPFYTNIIDSHGHILSPERRHTLREHDESVRKYIYQKHGVHTKYIYIPSAFEEEEIDWVDGKPVYGYTATCPMCGYSGPGDQF